MARLSPAVFVQRLTGKGYERTQIAKALQVDPRAIAAAERGRATPELREGLRALSRARAPRPGATRAGRSTALAQKAPPPAPARAQTPSGRSYGVYDLPQHRAELRRYLAFLAEANTRIRLSITFTDAVGGSGGRRIKDGRVELYGTGGWDAVFVRDLLLEHGIENGLEYLALQRPDITRASNPLSVEITEL